MIHWLDSLRHSASPQLDTLAAMLEVPPDELEAVRKDPRYCYQHFTIGKRSGGKRRIAAPSGRLKRLQRRLLDRYLNQQPIHESATAFRPGGSIAEHARRHTGQAIVLSADLTDFFESTTSVRIRKWFRDADWDSEATRILMRLCVYRGGLPQGAPTSPALSNLVNLPLDAKLNELATRSGAIYSRYSDDLAFSWSTADVPRAFRLEVEECLHRFAYSIQPLKGWQLQHAADRPEVTGIVIDGARLRLPHRILKRWRSLKRRWSLSDDEQQQLNGYRGLLKMLKPRPRFR